MLCLRSISLASGLVALCLPLGFSIAVQAADDAELTAIRQQASTYLNALNEGDQATLEATWTTDGVYVDAGGASQNARELIALKFGEPSPQRRTFRMTETRLRMIAPDVAIQEGMTEFAEGPSGEAAKSLYSDMGQARRSLALGATPRIHSAESPSQYSIR